MVNWNKIRSEYINGNISYRKLAEKHGISESNLMARAAKEKWFEKRKEQRSKIQAKTEQKTAEILAEKEAQRLLRISAAADKLLAKVEKAIEESDVYLAKDKRKYRRFVTDKTTNRQIPVDIEEEELKSVKLKRIDKAGLKQIASTLKDLRDIQFAKEEETTNEPPNINITISAATPIEENEVDEEQ